jgi:WD40 repeat protein
VLIVFQGRILVHGQREEGLEFFWKNVDAPIVPEYIQIIDVHANGKWGLAIHGKQGYIYNLENGQVTVARTIALKDKAITTARFSPCGKYLLTGYSNGAFSLYDWQKKNELYLGKSDHTITGVSLSGDGDTIVARSDFGLFLTSCKEMRALSPLAKVVLSQLSLEKDNTALFKTKSFQKIVNSFAPELKEKLIAEFGLKEEDASAEECLICRAEPAVFTTSCNHNFCPTCIARWQVEHSTCPTCRRNL